MSSRVTMFSCLILGGHQGSWWVVCGVGGQTRNRHPAHRTFTSVRDFWWQRLGRADPCEAFSIKKQSQRNPREKIPGLYSIPIFEWIIDHPAFREPTFCHFPRNLFRLYQKRKLKEPKKATNTPQMKLFYKMGIGFPSETSLKKADCNRRESS